MDKPWELKPDELESAARQAIIPAYGSGAAEHRHAEYKEVAQAAQRKLVEWLEGFCTQSLHIGGGMGKLQRKDCPFCWQAVCK